MACKIAFFDAKQYDRIFFDEWNKKYDFELNYFTPCFNKQTALLAKGHDIVCLFIKDVVNRETIEILEGYGVKLIALRCAGYNNVDLRSAYRRIRIVRVPKYSPYAIAEHACSLMLALNRKIHKSYNRTRDANFSINGLLGFDMHGKTAGVIGTGKIGRCLIEILKGFGMKVLAFDRYPDRLYAENRQLEYVDLKEIYRSCDILSLHCPLTAETHHLIDNQAIKSMKKNVMIINTGRGELIETLALVEGVKSRHIGAVGLDVYEGENEYFFEDHSGSIICDDLLARLLTFPNVIVTSHQAFFTKEALYNIAQTTYENIQAYLNGEVLSNEICYEEG